MLERDPGSLFPRQLRRMHSPAMMTAARRKPGGGHGGERVSKYKEVEKGGRGVDISRSKRKREGEGEGKMLIA